MLHFVQLRAGHTDEMDQSHFVFSISNSARSSVQWSDGLVNTVFISGLNEQPKKNSEHTVAIEFVVAVQIKRTGALCITRTELDSTKCTSARSSG